MNNKAFQQLLAEGKIIGVLETGTIHNQLWQKARVNHGEGITTDEWFQVWANEKHVKVGRPVGSSSLSIDWSKVDWNKSSRELEAELDTSYTTKPSKADCANCLTAFRTYTSGNSKRFMVAHTPRKPRHD